LASGLSYKQRQSLRAERTAAVRAFVDCWQACAVRYRLKPMIRAAGMMQRRLENVLNGIPHCITNALAERGKWEERVESSARRAAFAAVTASSGAIFPLWRVDLMA